MSALFLLLWNLPASHIQVVKMVSPKGSWLRLRVPRPLLFSGRLNITYRIWDIYAKLINLLSLLKSPESQLQQTSCISLHRKPLPPFQLSSYHNSLWTEPFLLLVFWWWCYFMDCFPDDNPLLACFSRNHSIAFSVVCLTHLVRTHCLTLDSAQWSMPSVGLNCGLKRVLFLETASCHLAICLEFCLSVQVIFPSFCFIAAIVS